ncbi:MAG: zinc ribbon domain-containing protein [Clostridiales bacterium]|jgi:hypothetical protein|nr:zinc ribbon domain-containing protein [Clostridiales bacterium]
MAFFDDMSKKIAQTSQGAAQKAKNMAETIKLNGLISDEEKRINNALLQIGKYYYEVYGENPEPSFGQLIAGINESKARIVSYSEQIKQFKGIVRCQKCGAETPCSSPFCNACGSPMNINSPASVSDGDKIVSLSVDESVSLPEATENFSAPSGDTISCPSCGKELSAKAVFCSGCGIKTEPKD